MSLFKRKKKDKQEEFTFEELKEPFTWRNFWDEQIIGRALDIKKFLDEKGVIFFLRSSFQYRNRLIAGLSILCLGVVLGVVPRTIHLLHETRERNADSELSSIRNKTFAIGPMSVSAIASGQYHKTHLLVFKIVGDTNEGVPSTDDGFKVDLTTSRGVTDEEHTNYRYTVVPVNTSLRLLLVYVDNRKQNDNTGIYNISIGIKGDKSNPVPMEVILSNTQKNTKVYKGGEINMSVLSSKLGVDSGTAIEDAKEKLKNALNVYKLNEERLNAAGITIGMSYDSMKAWVKDHSILTGLSDKSTTKDLPDTDPTPVQADSLRSSLTIETKQPDGSIKKETYTDDSKTQDLGADTAQSVEIPELSKVTGDVQSAVSSLNSARLTKFNNLKSMSRTLNQEITVDSMVDKGPIKLPK